MKRFLFNALKRFLKTLFLCSVGGVLVLVLLAVLYLDSRSELEIWHETFLDAEFTAGVPVESFEEYLALEARLFEQLEKRVVDKVSTRTQPSAVNRYIRGSLSYPGRWTVDWNRTFELKSDPPVAGVLLLHGMSDSPYSLRSIGEGLHASGAWVVGLRLPGHGTVPSGLVTMHWKDLAAAVRLAVMHLHREVGNKPLYIVGYSNGGALAVHYALTSLEEDSLPRVSGLVLISPAIGVGELASLAVWQARIGNLLGLKKVVWNSILPEYDPFKYQSFAVNAGDQVYRLTKEIQSRIQSLAADKKLNRFPPALAFQSAVDATVSTRAVVEGLFEKLPLGGHELVVFDVNHRAKVLDLLAANPDPDLQAMFQREGLPFTFSLVTNETAASSSVVLRRRFPGEEEVTIALPGLSWPETVYSLAHVALPFPEVDPLYGAVDAGDPNKITLGNLELRGERGVLQIPAADMLRLKWNPFYSLMERRLLAFLGLGENG